MAQPQMGYQHSAVRKRRPEAVYGSKQETFIGRDTTSSRVTLELKCAANIYFWRRAQIFLLLMLQNLCTRGNLTQVAFFDGFCRGFIFKYVITQNASGPTFIWGLGNFKFVIFTHFSTFNPARLIASSAMQIQPPPTICNWGEFRLQKSVIPNPTKRLCSTNMQSHLKICFWPI